MPSWVMSTISSCPLVNFAVDQAIVFLDLDGDDAAFADVLKIAEIRFLHDAGARAKRRRATFRSRFPRRSSVLGREWWRRSFRRCAVRADWRWSGLCGARPLGNLVDSLDVTAADLGEEHQVIVRGGGEEMLDEIAVFLGRAFARGHADHALAAAALRAIGADRGALDEAAVRDGDDDAFVGDEILDG